MDQHQQQHHAIQQDDHNQISASTYTFYTPDPDNSFIGYNPQMAPYPVVQHTPQARVGDLHQQGIQPYHHNLTLISPHQYQGPVYPSSPPHVSLPLSHSPPPPSPDMYDPPLSPPVSGSDTSADGLYHHSNSSGANSPSSSRANSLVHRHVRYNPTPSPTSSSGRRRGRSHDSDDDDMGVAFVENLAHTRKEATRRQRIEAEQRRRDELRDGYAKLKDALPLSNQKSSKVSLLERATNHIRSLEASNKELQARLAEIEQEVERLRAINEKISLGSNETPSPGTFNSRPLSPPPDAPLVQSHSLASVRGQQVPSEHSSPSASDSGY
ncbi:hypothetical protein BDQ12DRAFT_598591 [Crucibulum laeve]|uniref:BHLH domain-containing protein n=1 Tax=Crucibulum laeve TaxID=68775 RepID=A0A5C3MDG7_9AGAR|nr:hypothetical protein BDQ12DRAFT_598591 [Crucibulum laeve]